MIWSLIAGFFVAVFLLATYQMVAHAFYRKKCAKGNHTTLARKVRVWSEPRIETTISYCFHCRNIVNPVPLTAFGENVVRLRVYTKDEYTGEELERGLIRAVTDGAPRPAVKPKRPRKKPTTKRKRSKPTCYTLIDSED